MARKTIRISDMSGTEIPDGKGATFASPSQMLAKASERLTSLMLRPERLGGRPVTRRGRRPKSQS
jgi:hypothetical protein